MHYLFLDETRKYIDQNLRFVVVCVELPQSSFNSSIEEASQLDLPGRESRLIRIKRFIAENDGHALISYIDIEKSLIPARKKDDSLLPGVAGYNILWGAVMTYAVAEMVASLIRKGVSLKTVDIFYDNKSLAEEHRDAIEDVIRKNLAELASKYLKYHANDFSQVISFRKIECVPKSPSSIRNKYQIGTWLADRLCSRSDELILAGSDGIVSAHDFSLIMRDIFSNDKGAGLSG